MTAGSYDQQRAMRFVHLLDASLIRAVEADDAMNLSAIRDAFETMVREQGIEKARYEFSLSWSTFIDCLEGTWQHALREFRSLEMFDAGQIYVDRPPTL